MKTIAVDLDDTLIGFIEPFVNWLNSTYEDSEYELHKITSYKIRDVYHEPHVDWEQRLHAFVESQFQHEHPPLPHAKETLALLGDSYRLIVVTARPETQREYTENWLVQEFPGVFDSVHMRTNFSATHDKGRVCTRLGAAVLIDDAVHNIDAAISSGVRGILFGDYPMQHNYIQDHHERALDWQQVGRLLLV